MYRNVFKLILGLLVLSTTFAATAQVPSRFILGLEATQNRYLMEGSSDREYQLDTTFLLVKLGGRFLFSSAFSVTPYLSFGSSLNSSAKDTLFVNNSIYKGIDVEFDRLVMIGNKFNFHPIPDLALYLEASSLTLVGRVGIGANKTATKARNFGAGLGVSYLIKNKVQIDISAHSHNYRSEDMSFDESSMTAKFGVNYFF